MISLHSISQGEFEYKYGVYDTSDLYEFIKIIQKRNIRNLK